MTTEAEIQAAEQARRFAIATGGDVLAATRDRDLAIMAKLAARRPNQPRPGGPEMSNTPATVTGPVPEPRMLRTGTVTEWGTLEEQTLTGWFTTKGEFVPFATMQGKRWESPLVMFG